MAISVTNDLVNKLKKIFNDPGTILFSEGDYDLSSGTSGTALELNFTYRLPVAVDTLQVTQDDPTVNHYKIIGMSGDWTSSASLGDVSIQLTVPNVSFEALEMCFGTDNVKEATNIKVGDETFAGSGIVLKKHRMSGTIGVLASNDKDLMVISGAYMYAKLLYDNPGTDPFAIQLNGGIDADESKPSIVWLTKTESGS